MHLFYIKLQFGLAGVVRILPAPKITYEHVTSWQRGPAGVIKVKNLQWEDLPVGPRWTILPTRPQEGQRCMKGPHRRPEVHEGAPRKPKVHKGAP